MKFDLAAIADKDTPFYYYDLKLLDETLDSLHAAIAGRPVHVHYAIKANSNPVILKKIARAGFGADCVSGGELTLAIAAGFRPADITYAGVGKTDREIRQSLKEGIGCFNVESLEELQIIAGIAERTGIKAPVAIRVNPDIDAHTHHYITTGLEENKFGIAMEIVDEAVGYAAASPWLDLIGLHFHIGSQVTITEPFRILAGRVNDLLDKYRARGIEFRTINVGGGLGIDYDDPDANPVPDFKSFMDVICDGIRLTPGQEIHIEPGRCIVGQCGTLMARVLYVKKGVGRKFVIIDAGMNDLIRPALYQAEHRIQNLSAPEGTPCETYDVVGPVCETADTFATGVQLPRTRRGDIIAIRSAGAYGETMASTYNARPLAGSLFV